MTLKNTFTCDVCGKPIKTEREKLFMVTIRISGYSYNYDGGSDKWANEYHAHNDQTSSSCAQKLFKVLREEG